jgi:hypothetical protein
MPSGAKTSVSGFWSTGPASDRGIGLLHHGATVSDPAFEDGGGAASALSLLAYGAFCSGRRTTRVGATPKVTAVSRPRLPAGSSQGDGYWCGSGCSDLATISAA